MVEKPRQISDILEDLLSILKEVFSELQGIRVLLTRE
jgi:hypothetical protein